MIVVIGILAALVLNTISGVQERARVAAANSELRSLSKQTEAYNVEEGVYPQDSTEWKLVFERSNLYEATRDSTKKSFVICWSATGYGIAAWRPVQPISNGKNLYVVNSSTGLTAAAWSNTTPGTYTDNKACALALPDYTNTSWSYNLP